MSLGRHWYRHSDTSPQAGEPALVIMLVELPGLFNALVLDWVSPKCNTLMQTAVG